ncbi:MAG: hypothetical protein HC881_17240 [Leptolyngbyaceae cyanobacterium SL_7_1]|nr:hypothetical protein [Leptolyngbyaceae cyanobacterium SL_7_1]
MDIARLVVHLIIAAFCAGIATILIPRRVPGKLFGLVLIGLAGVWVGDWAFLLLSQQFGLVMPVLHTQVQGVLVIPAIVGSTIVLYLVTTVLRWAQ